MSLTLDDDLAGRFAQLRAAEPRLRIRDAARRLGASEAELVQSLPGARRLRPDWPALLGGLEACGPVMALTRNEACVHERHGTYRDVQAGGHVGLVLGEEIDLRLFLNRWAAAFFVPEGQPGSPRGSLQVFDAQGEAVHKVFATERTQPGTLTALADGLAEAAAPFVAIPAAARKPDEPDATRDAAGLRAAWAGLQDTHDFFPMLRRFGVGRAQAFRLAGPDWARPLDNAAVPAAITRAAETGLPVMIFVGNPGCIQIHTGTVSRIVPMEGWFNVLDPDFNLHLRTGAITATWLVRKPTADGVVTSIECFDAAGEVILMLFGKRKPGVPEDADWRALAAAVAA